MGSGLVTMSRLNAASRRGPSETPGIVFIKSGLEVTEVVYRCKLSSRSIIEV